MEYKTVLHPYVFSSLVSDAKGKLESQTSYEPLEWNATLNKYSKEKWVVKESGTVVSGNDLIFWAFLERPEKTEGVLSI